MGAVPVRTRFVVQDGQEADQHQGFQGHRRAGMDPVVEALAEGVLGEVHGSSWGCRSIIRGVGDDQMAGPLALNKRPPGAWPFASGRIDYLTIWFNRPCVALSHLFQGNDLDLTGATGAAEGFVAGQANLLGGFRAGFR